MAEGDGASRVALVSGAARGIGRGFLAWWTDYQLLFQLALVMALQGAHYPLKQAHGPTARVLGLGKPESAVAPDALQLAVHPERIPVQVYALPAERECLALPEPARGTASMVYPSVTRVIDSVDSAPTPLAKAAK